MQFFIANDKVTYSEPITVALFQYFSVNISNNFYSVSCLRQLTYALVMQCEQPIPLTDSCMLLS